MNPLSPEIKIGIAAVKKIAGYVMEHFKDKKYKKEVYDAVFKYSSECPDLLSLCMDKKFCDEISALAQGKIIDCEKLVKLSVKSSKNSNLPVSETRIINVLDGFAKSTMTAISETEIKQGEFPMAFSIFLDCIITAKTNRKMNDIEDSVKELAKLQNQEIEIIKPNHIEKVISKLEQRFLIPFSIHQEYDIRLAFVNNINDIPDHWKLLADYGMEALTPENLLKDDHKNDFILMQAPGGSGKTSFLIELFKKAPGKGFIPFFLDLSRRIGRKSETISLTIKDSDRTLFDAFSLSGSFDYMLELAKDNKILIIADGLNESDLSSETILPLLNQIERLYPSDFLIIISDRMKEKGRIFDYKIATILPLSKTAINAYINVQIDNDDFLKLLSIPFFLDLHNRSSSIQPEGRIQMIEGFYHKVGEVSANELDLLGEVSFLAYKKFNSTEFDNSWWESNISKKLADRFQQAGITYIRGDNDNKKCMFRHQTLHDILVGRYLFRNGNKYWQPKFFESATLEKSFEVLEFTAEYLPEGDADKFLIEVYDWSWQAVINIISRLQSIIPGEKISFSPLLMEAFCANLAEKQFDHYKHTSENIKERISSYRSTLDINYLGPTRN